MSACKHVSLEHHTCAKRHAENLLGETQHMQAHLANIIDKYCISNAHHERHALQAITGLCRVAQPLRKDMHVSTQEPSFQAPVRLDT